MLDITILAISTIKESYYQEAINEYLKRIAPYAKIKSVELKAESFGKNNKEKAKKIEGERVLKYLEKNFGSRIFLLDEKGKSLDSNELALCLDKTVQSIIFVIGGSLGLDEEVKSKNFDEISLSSLTFPHELARVILVEQIYRSITINRNKNYHY